jgi:hypothetical protein
MWIKSMLIACAFLGCGCVRQATVAHVSPNAGAIEVRTFTGTWIDEDATFNDGVPHRLEIEIKEDGTFRGVHTDLSSNMSYRGSGTWKRTSPVDAVGIFDEPCEAVLLHVSRDDQLTVTSRTGQVRLHRAKSMASGRAEAVTK